jgi:hypothetical protein
LREPVCERLPGLTAGELLGADRLPVPVDRFDRLGWQLVDRDLEMFGPEVQSCPGA